jgi:hypothetical protein
MVILRSAGAAYCDKCHYDAAMTGQIPDSVAYRGGSYLICGVHGEGLFEPAAHRLAVVPLSTACWRGYVADYAVLDGTLSITQLLLGLSDESGDRLPARRAPRLFGATPVRDRHYGGLRYTDLREPCRFTGGLLLGQDLVPGTYVHMGFQRYWKYAAVHELLLEEGRVVEEHDRSAGVARLRATAPDDRPDHTDPDAVRAWVADTFSLRYQSPG